MAEIFSNCSSNPKAPSSTCKRYSEASDRRRSELGRQNLVSGESSDNNDRLKRQKIQRFMEECENAVENGELNRKMYQVRSEPDECPKFGYSSICGLRRDMEDAVTIQPSFCSNENGVSDLHYFGVYDGHGCSHVATRCKDRLHELVKEEVEGKAVESMEWKKAMETSFRRMDSEVITCKEAVVLAANCGCKLETPESDGAGSTAVVALITSEKIVVANCGDSRAVLCRKRKAIPLSRDHKPDLPDELNRIQTSGGRVIYWDVPRVLGVLAMSRAIGDNYLKPYVSCEPEVSIVNRSSDDEFLILASDGLWDVMSNETACSVVRMCMRLKNVATGNESGGYENSNRACSKASTVLTRLALARGSSDNVSVIVIDLKKDT